MLEQMKRKDERGRMVPFTVRLVECNRSKRTGGKLVTHENVTLPKREAHNLTDKLKQSVGVAAQVANDTARKKPLHTIHGTINFLFGSGEIRKGHIGLITQFNAMKVI